MISIAIVDDEQIYIDKIQNLLTMYLEDIKIYSYHSVKDIDSSVDFLILDINMPDVDGICYSKQHTDIKIIFVTNYDTRIKEAFGSNVYGYVSKNNLENELVDKVSEVIDIINNTIYVSFKVEGIDIHIKMNDIIYCQYLGGRNVAIIYNNQQVKVGDTTLKKILDTLDDRFIKINRDTVINKNMIADYSNQYLYLNGIACKFDVSVRNRTLVKKCFFERFQ